MHVHGNMYDEHEAAMTWSGGLIIKAQRAAAGSATADAPMCAIGAGLLPALGGDVELMAKMDYRDQKSIRWKGWWGCLYLALR